MYSQATCAGKKETKDVKVVKNAIERDIIHILCIPMHQHATVIKYERYNKRE